MNACKILGYATLALAAAGLVSCAQQAAPSADLPLPTIGLINGSPRDYVGRYVTLSGKVADIYQPGMIVLFSPDTGEKMLVLAKLNPPEWPMVQRDDMVRVSGMVRTFAAGLDTGTGPSFDASGLAADANLYALWRDRPCIITSDLQVLEEPPLRGPGG